jgi:hypothetical protein
LHNQVTRSRPVSHRRATTHVVITHLVKRFTICVGATIRSD